MGLSVSVLMLIYRALLMYFFEYPSEYLRKRSRGVFANWQKICKSPYDNHLEICVSTQISTQKSTWSISPVSIKCDWYWSMHLWHQSFIFHFLFSQISFSWYLLFWLVNPYCGHNSNMLFYDFVLQLTITLKKEEGDSKTQYNEYCYAGGLLEYVKWLNTDKVLFTQWSWKFCFLFLSIFF